MFTLVTALWQLPTDLSHHSEPRCHPFRPQADGVAEEGGQAIVTESLAFGLGMHVELFNLEALRSSHIHDCSTKVVSGFRI